MKSNLSPTMNSALGYMRKHGNTIRRFPGGFWAHSDWKGRGEFSYRASTINALESRGEIEWIAHQERKGGKGFFPIGAKIKEPK